MNCEAYERKGRLEGRAEGMAEGRAEGLLEGMAEGRRLQNEEIVRRLASMGMSVEDISEATGMSVEDVRRLVRRRRQGRRLAFRRGLLKEGNPKVITASRFTPRYDERRPGRHTLPDAR